MSSSEDDDFACVCCLSNILKIANTVEARDSKPKWYQCPEGHLFCEKCYKLIGGESALCSVCRIAMGKVRNRFAENLFNKLTSEAHSRQAVTGKPCISGRSGKLDPLPSPSPVNKKDSGGQGHNSIKQTRKKFSSKKFTPAEQGPVSKSKCRAPNSMVEFFFYIQRWFPMIQYSKSGALIMSFVFIVSLLFFSNIADKAIQLHSISRPVDHGNATAADLVAEDRTSKFFQESPGLHDIPAQNLSAVHRSIASQNKLNSPHRRSENNSGSLSENNLSSPSENLSHSEESACTVELNVTAPSVEMSQYLLLAQKCDAEAQYKVGELLEVGWPDSPPNQEKAFEFFHLAAEQGLASAEYKVGDYFENGMGAREKNDAKALAHYRKAAQLGSLKAHVALGRFFQSGTGGVKKSEQTAVKYFQQAADQGEPLGQYHLGKLTKDKKESAKYMRLAAEQGLASAQQALGRYYATGHGVPRDFVYAAKYYQLAADQGLPESQLRMGAYYTQGIGGLPVDVHKALRYFELSAGQGLKHAQFALGLLYEDGMKFMEPDRRRALQQFQAAAEQGLPEAQYVLATYHERGLGGLTTDLKAAVELFRRSAAQGNENAVAALQRLGVR